MSFGAGEGDIKSCNLPVCFLVGQADQAVMNYVFEFEK